MLYYYQRFYWAFEFSVFASNNYYTNVGAANAKHLSVTSLGKNYPLGNEIFLLFALFLYCSLLLGYFNLNQNQFCASEGLREELWSASLAFLNSSETAFRIVCSVIFQCPFRVLATLKYQVDALLYFSAISLPCFVSGRE